MAPRKRAPRARSAGTTRRRKKRPTQFQPVNGEERVLALDPSSRCCGWAVFDNGHYVASGRHVQDGDSHGERLATFRVWLLELLAAYQPHRLVYEAPYRGLNGKTFGILSRYAGIVECCHFEHFHDAIPEEDAVPARDVKRAIGAPPQKRGRQTRGKGSRTRKNDPHELNKILVLNMVNEHFGLALKYKANDDAKKVTQDDEADAIAVNWAWHILNRPPVEEPPTDE